jgi:hypothetical protein
MNDGIYLVDMYDSIVSNRYALYLIICTVNDSIYLTDMYDNMYLIDML